MEEYSIQLKINILSLADIFSFTAAIILGFLFLTVKSDNRRANVFLSLFLFSLAGEVLDVLMEPILHDEIWAIQSSLFTIPFLLLYTKQTTNSHYNYYAYLLFIPGIILNILGHSYVLIEYIFNIALLIYMLRHLHKHQLGVKQYYSNLEMNTMKWILVIVYIFLAFHALWIIEDIVILQADWLENYFAGLSSLLTLFMIIWIGHNGFSQPEIFKQKMFVTTLRKDITDTKEKELNKDHEKWMILTAVIQSERLYTDPKLNLRALSQASNLNEKEVSRLINQQANCNFYQFINRFRVDAFKELLLSNRAKQLSLVGLAEEAGFNSKSTFYSTFKTLEGQTPKQYYDTLILSE